MRARLGVFGEVGRRELYGGRQRGRIGRKGIRRRLSGRVFSRWDLRERHCGRWLTCGSEEQDVGLYAGVLRSFGYSGGAT